MSQSARIRSLTAPDNTHVSGAMSATVGFDITLPHKHWRVKVNSVNGGTYASIGNIKLFTKDNAAVDLLSGNVAEATASSIYSTYYPSNVTDGDLATNWRSLSGQQNGSWVAIETVDAITVNALSLGLSRGTKTYWPTSITVSYSDDGEGWLDVGTFALTFDSSTDDHSVTRLFDLDNDGSQGEVQGVGELAGAHTYWRLLILGNNGDTGYITLDYVQYQSDICTEVDQTGALMFASSEYAPYYTAAFLLDDLGGGDYTWRSSQYDIKEAFVAIQFPSPVDINAVRLKSEGYAYGIDASPTDTILQYSDDGVNWYSRAELLYSWPAGTTDQVKGLTLDGYYVGCANVTIPLIEADGFTNNINGAMTLPAMTSTGSMENNYLYMPALTAEGYGESGNTTSVIQEEIDLPALTVAAEGLHGEAITGAMTLPMITMTAQLGLSTEITIPSITLVAQGGAGILYTADVTLPSLSVEAEGTTEGVGAASLSLPALSVEASGVTGSIGSMTATLAALALSAEGATGSVGTVSLELPLVEVSAGGETEAIGTASVTLPVLYVEATGGTGEEIDGYATTNTGGFVMNTRTKALTEYQNTPFNSLAAFNGSYIGATSDGIYLLQGAADGIAAIDATIKTGAMDMESLQLKRLKRAYVSYRTDGELVLTAIYDEGDSAEYILSQTGKQGVHQHRLKLGRGLKGKYVTLQIQNQDGADFDIDEIAIGGTITTRKV